MSISLSSRAELVSGMAPTWITGILLMTVVAGILNPRVNNKIVKKNQEQKLATCKFKLQFHLMRDLQITMNNIINVVSCGN